MPQQVLISYPSYATIKSYMIGRKLINRCLPEQIYTMFLMTFLWKYGFCAWMIWYWAGDKPSAEPMITQFTGHQASVCSKYQK